MNHAEYGGITVPLSIQTRSLVEGSQAMDLGRVHMDGLIALEYTPDDDLHDLHSQLHGQPLIVRMTDITMARPPFQSICIDYYEGCCSMLRHIVSRGWRKFQFIIEAVPSRPHLAQWERPLPAYAEWAIDDTSQSIGICIAYQRNMIRTPDRGTKARYDMMLEYLRNHRLEPGVFLIKDGADGISGTYTVLINMGYVVGHEVAVAALGAIPAWEHVEPVPTVVWERYEEISRLLVDVAMSGIEGRPTRLENAQFNYLISMAVTDSVPDISDGKSVQPLFLIFHRFTAAFPFMNNIDREATRTLLSGPIPSIRTPFLEDGRIDETGLRNIVEHHITAGAGVLMLMAGDSHYLCMSDKRSRA